MTANGPIWSRLERTRRGRSATPGRRSASPRRRRRTTAGRRIEPPVSEPNAERREAGGHGGRAAARRAARRRGSVSCGLRVGPNAEFSVDEPIANSSRFVFPIGMRPAATSRSTDGGVVRRLPALEDPRRARRRDAAGAEVVLERERARRPAGRDRRRPRPADRSRRPPREPRRPARG